MAIFNDFEAGWWSPMAVSVAPAVTPAATPSRTAPAPAPAASAGPDASVPIPADMWVAPPPVSLPATMPPRMWGWRGPVLAPPVVSGRGGLPWSPPALIGVMTGREELEAFLARASAAHPGTPWSKADLERLEKWSNELAKKASLPVEMGSPAEWEQLRRWSSQLDALRADALAELGTTQTRFVPTLSQQAPAVAAAVVQKAADNATQLTTPADEADVSLTQDTTAPISDVPEVVSLAPAKAAAAAILQTEAKKRAAPGQMKKVALPTGGAVAGFLVGGPVGAGIGAAIGWFLGREPKAAPAAAAASAPTVEELKKRMLEEPNY